MNFIFVEKSIFKEECCTISVLRYQKYAKALIVIFTIKVGIILTETGPEEGILKWSSQFS